MAPPSLDKRCSDLPSRPRFLGGSGTSSSQVHPPAGSRPPPWFCRQVGGEGVADQTKDLLSLLPPKVTVNIRLDYLHKRIWEGLKCHPKVRCILLISVPLHQEQHLSIEKSLSFSTHWDQGCDVCVVANPKLVRFGVSYPFLRGCELALATGRWNISAGHPFLPHPLP